MANMPFVSGKVAQTALQAGLADDSFGMGYKSEADRQMQKAQADAKIAELIKGKELEQQAIQNNLALANEEAARQGLKPGKYSIQASQSGIGVNPESTDPLTNFLKMEQIKSLNEERENRKVQDLSKRYENAQVPAITRKLQELETVTSSNGDSGGLLTNPSYEVKSAGPFMNILPDFARGAASSLGELVGAVPKGAARENQVIQDLMNYDIKKLSGAAVTTYEMGRQKVAKGYAMGGDPSLVREGVRDMQKALASDAQNIEAGVSPAVRERYKSYGGDIATDTLRSLEEKTSKITDSKKKRLEELRNKKAGS